MTSESAPAEDYRRRMAESWLSDPRSSYHLDTEGYAEQVRGLLLVGFHVGDGTQHTSTGHTGRAIEGDSHRRALSTMTAARTPSPTTRAG